MQQESTGHMLPPNHYRVRVTYAPLPTEAEMCGQRDWKRRWRWSHYQSDHGPCSLLFEGADRRPGERVFYLHDASTPWCYGREAVIAWGRKQRNEVAPKGYRPALEKELFEFVKVHPELVRGVGTVTMWEVLYGDQYCKAQVIVGRHFHAEWVGDTIPASRVLLVSRWV